MTEQYHWQATRTLQGHNYYPFPSDFPRIQYLAVFRQGEKKETRKVCTELRIAKETDIFDDLRKRQSEINARFDDAFLDWYDRTNHT